MGKTNNINLSININLLLLSNFYPVISYRRVQKISDELLFYDLVTRYGPQSVASASGRSSLFFRIFNKFFISHLLLILGTFLN